MNTENDSWCEVSRHKKKKLENSNIEKFAPGFEEPESAYSLISSKINSSRAMLPDNLMFVMFVTENGNGYENDYLQKIVTFGYDQPSIDNMFNMLYLIDRHNTQNKKLLYMNILDYDMTILNFDFLNKYTDITDYQKTHIFSIDVNNEQELSVMLINLFTLMINNFNVMQILYTRRKKYINGKRMFFFLIKIFINKKLSFDEIKNTILTPKNILNKKIKVKIDDLQMDKTNINEKGIRKNNWINI